MLSAFSVEHCPPSRWNTVRHQHGIVSAIAWNTQAGSVLPVLAVYMLRNKVLAERLPKHPVSRCSAHSKWFCRPMGYPNPMTPEAPSSCFQDRPGTICLRIPGHLRHRSGTGNMPYESRC
ncbi:hypothetical protein BV908_09140 [Diaphorobacter sp. LR2014-1]|nr:hypothetical protein BV908_09140 [Diaphorobacter sp. LR2014-1]